MDKSRLGKRFHHDSYGFYYISKYEGWDGAWITFEATLYTYKTRYSHAKDGCVLDRLNPSFCGVGYLGDNKYNYNDKDPLISRAIRAWSSMITRCYTKNKKKRSSYPTYEICEVESHWHDMGNFVDWYIENYPVDGLDYQLDKDKKFKGNKLYSRGTCSFISQEENVQIANAKTYKFKSPQGLIVEIENLCEFCRKNDLYQSNMVAVNNKRRNTHKGWTRA